MGNGSDIAGVVLAGGLGRRMGGLDKGLQPFRGRPLVAWVIERFAPQVATLVINANRNHETYERYGHPVIPDIHPGFAGPLAGLHAALSACHAPLVATVPCDTPLLPADLVARLAAGLDAGRADLAVARAAGRLHPVFCVCRRELLDSLDAYLKSGERRVAAWQATQRHVEVDFDDCAETFHNVNEPADLAP